MSDSKVESHLDFVILFSNRNFFNIKRNLSISCNFCNKSTINQFLSTTFFETGSHFAVQFMLKLTM